MQFDPASREFHSAATPGHPPARSRADPPRPDIQRSPPTYAFLLRGRPGHRVPHRPHRGSLREVSSSIPPHETLARDVACVEAVCHHSQYMRSACSVPILSATDWLETPAYW